MATKSLRSLLPALVLLFIPAFTSAAGPATPTRPNIVLIYADDLGYGDLSCYGAKSVQTPNLDRLAAEGIRFTDGHAAAATCTPSRYAMLTGEYAWRRKGTGILPGDAALIIEPGRATLPAILQKAGYVTGAVGKWHLGLGDGDVDWNGEIKPGPLEIGFDECFILPATGDRVPCVYVENHRVANLDAADPIRVSYDAPLDDGPTGAANPDKLRIHPSRGHDQSIVNGISRIGYMSGGEAARWVDEDMADVLTDRATKFIDRHRAEPFFLFYAAHDIHVPRTPHPRFVGKTDMGPRGDAIVQLDWCVGQVLEALDRLDLADNTLVLFTSDNGPVIDDGYRDDATERLGDHRASGPWRGGKYSPYEGGTRVPWIVRWPLRVEPGESAALVCQVDLPATMAALVESPLPGDAAPDSVNVLPALVGQSPSGRDHLVEQARELAVRKGAWKFIPAGGDVKKPQLFNLAEDPAEAVNLADRETDRVSELNELLKTTRRQGKERRDRGAATAKPGRP